MPQSVASRRGAPAWWDAPAKVGILCLIGFILSGGVALSLPKFARFSEFFDRPLEIAFWGMTLCYSLIMYTAFVWRVWLWSRYKPMPAVSDDRLPTVTVVIPAFNEGALVRQSIESVATGDYPREKLQVIIVDDGSTDDTWQYILAAAEDFKSICNITTHKQPENRGKRAALYHGFTHGTGDVFVTMDSDSIFASDSLRHAVSPMVLDPRIGNVAGCVEVMNVHDSIWTRFLNTTFSLSFKFVRAYQNQYRGVFCSPGALSVYRADLVHKVADEWLNQTFLGKECRTGEDRAMTNLAIREGYHTVYQESAKVWAQMPTTYMGVCMMLLRWARSNIRETIFLQRFMFKPFRRDKGVNAFRINMLLVLSTLIVPYIMIGMSLGVILMNPLTLLHHNSLVVLFGLTMAMIVYRNDRGTDWIWLMLYELIWVVGFVWIMPYAALTLKNTSWITRGAPEVENKKVPAEPVPQGIPSMPQSPSHGVAPSMARSGR